MTEAEIILFFSLWSGHLTELGGIYTDNLMKEVLRSLIWKLILWLRTVCISVERLYFKVFDVMDIASGEDVVLFSGGLRYYVVAVLSLSILSAGYRMMVSCSSTPMEISPPLVGIHTVPVLLVTGSSGERATFLIAVPVITAMAFSASLVGRVSAEA